MEDKNIQKSLFRKKKYLYLKNIQKKIQLSVLSAFNINGLEILKSTKDIKENSSPSHITLT